MKQVATVWLVGQFESDEFDYALQGLPGEVRCQRFATVTEAVVAARPSEQALQPPEIMVLAQSRPGEVSAGALEQLHRAQPLAQLVLLLGAWCEGEMRTGFPLPGATRMFWHSFPIQFKRLLSQLRSGRGTAWAWPRIAGQQERLLQQIPAQVGSCRTERPSAVVAIRTSQFTAFDILADCLAPHGYRCLWLDPLQPFRFAAAEALVFDAPRLDAHEWNLLDKCRAALNSPATVLLAGFPRYHDHLQAAARGIEQLLGKPFLNDDLLAAVELALAGRRHATTEQPRHTGTA